MTLVESLVQNVTSVDALRKDETLKDLMRTGRNVVNSMDRITMNLVREDDVTKVFVDALARNACCPSAVLSSRVINAEKTRHFERLLRTLIWA